MAYYTFDGNIFDQTGRHNGTLYGSTNYVPGVVGQALNFSLNSQGRPTFVESANPGTIDFGRDFSVSLWLATTATGQQNFLSKNVTNTWAYPGKQFMTRGPEMLADCYGSGDFCGNFTGNGVSIDDGRWHHVVLTYCATISPYWHWYVDGYATNSYGHDFTLGNDSLGQHLRIGMREDGSDYDFQGQMDQLQIYDQALTADQAQYLFRNPGSVVTNTLYETNFVNSGALFPRAAVQASTNIFTLNVDGLSTPDLFMALTFQGCVNRIWPRIYLIGHGIVEMQRAISTQFWLDQMPDYVQTPYRNEYGMIADFTNDLNGCVLYDPSMFNSTSDDDLAQINQVIMLCARYGAMAVTTNQFAALADAGVRLPVLADARTLGTKWTTIYSYALTNLAPFMKTNILHHLAGENGTNFCLWPVDYLVAQKIFSYNVPAHINRKERIILNKIMALTPANTPVIGVWGLDYGVGEHGFISQLSAVGKFMTVMHESGNLSFTTGLPMANIPDQRQPSLALNTNDVYVAFTESDGDNYSFVDRIWPLYLDVTNRIACPLGFELCPMVNELNPVAAAWFYRNIGTTFVTPCCGLSYEWNWNSPGGRQHPADPWLAPFLRLTDKYMGAMQQRIVRTTGADYEDALPYGALSNAIGVHIGYNGTGIAVSNVQSADFISRGKAFFQGYNFDTDVTNIARYAGPTPAFFSIGCTYVSVPSIVAAASRFPSNYVVVSLQELANLYRQYKTNDVLASQNITSASFHPLAPAELLYLYEDIGSNPSGTLGPARSVDYTNYWIYQFNMASAVTSATATLTLCNDYAVWASNDAEHWRMLVQSPTDVTDGSNLAHVKVNLTPFLGGAGNNIYLKFGNASPGTPGSATLLDLTLTSLGPVQQPNKTTARR
ncbi:MAG TPA: LamG-like jellyroll fold domain-containing protein [Candidatus Sulfotelmatobacter sp.]|nr:LamG-like jellyroll fold domain-containing protein [Candidatus Sulfotelmatobacter sp.]